MQHNQNQDQTTFIGAAESKDEKRGVMQAFQTGGPVRGGLIPQTFDQLWALSGVMARSGMTPKDIKTQEQVFVVLQMGLEIGLSPMQSVQNIAPINGRPSVWGDAALGLVRASGLLDKIQESIVGEGQAAKAVCKIKRKGDDVVSREFSMADAKTAGLAGGPVWSKYPKRMMQMRARSFALRDVFPDVLKGIGIREEVADMDLVEVSPGVYDQAQGASTSVAIRAALDAERQPAKKKGAKKPTPPPSEEHVSLWPHIAPGMKVKVHLTDGGFYDGIVTTEERGGVELDGGPLISADMIKNIEQMEDGP